MQSRSGFALLTVLVLTVLLALACYQFATTMLHEHQAAAGFGRQVQLRAAADSGLEYVAALLDAGITREELVDNEARLRSVALPGERQPTFSVVTSESASAERSVCYGLENLSTRIHLNAVASWDSAVGRQLLLALPGMTADVADGILDWIDADHKPREFGAEISNFPTSPFGFRNGPLRSIDEMLLIPGVTPEQLYGEDANGNGLLDRNEDDGEVSLPIDNADGLLDKGWAQWITLRSAEKNVRADGTPRINVNAASLGELFDELQAAIDINAAKFVVAYRLYGPFSPDGSLTAPASKHTAPQSEVGDDGAVVTTERAGLVLNSGPRFDINSIYDLVSVQVPYVDESGALLSSPWKLGKSPDSDFLAMEDLLTVDPAIRIVGRLRIARLQFRFDCGRSGNQRGTG